MRDSMLCRDIVVLNVTELKDILVILCQATFF